MYMYIFRYIDTECVLTPLVLRTLEKLIRSDELSRDYPGRSNWDGLSKINGGIWLPWASRVREALPMALYRKDTFSALFYSMWY